jgi:hypothetical protein
MRIAFLIPFLLAAQDKPPEKCTISGTVVNYATGEPLDKVQVEAAPTEGAPSSTTTDADGHFVLPNLEPGHYHLKGKRNRFLDTNYGARRVESSGTPITLEAGQNLKDLKFKLIPLGVIAGTIRDPEGEPLVRITVTALRVRFEDGRRKVTAVDSALTDDMGQYRVTGLAPGRYYIRAEPQAKGPGVVGPEGQFFFIASVVTGIGAPRAYQPRVLLPALFPGVQEPRLARTVDVETGARVTGIDMELPRSGTVSVKGHVSAPEAVHGGIVMLSRSQWLRQTPGLDEQLAAPVDERGDFAFPAVPQGSYTLAANVSRQQPPTPVAGTFSVPGAISVVQDTNTIVDETPSYEGRIPLEVGTTPLDGVRVAVAAPARITGRLTVVGDKEQAEGGSVTFDDGVSDTRGFDIREQQFSIDLPPGHYNVYLNLGSMLIRAITCDGRDITATGLTIAGPGKMNLEIVAAADGGALEGAVLDKDDKPAAGAKIVLIPEARFRSRNDRYFESDTDQQGHFEIQGIAPGEYKVFAWDDIEPGIWRDPDFVESVESKGEAVTVKASAKETIQLHAR